MTRLVLFSAENILKAKEAIIPLVQDFVKLEPKNLLVIPETKEGSSIIDRAFAKLQALGYSPEDAQLLVSEVVEALHDGRDPRGGGSSTTLNSRKDDNF